MAFSTVEGANGVGALVRVLAKPPLRRALIHVHTSAAGVHLKARKTGAVVVAGQVDTLLVGATFKLPSGAFVHVGAAFASGVVVVTRWTEWATLVTTFSILWQ